jgi:putative transposase
MDRLTPKDRGEQTALFRAEVIGGLARRELSRGELAAALREISAQRLRPPGAAATRTYAVPTLQRWYYALRRGGLEALVPRARTDRGRGRALTAAQRDLLLEIRREHPRASVPLILRTLVADGRLEPRSVSAPTVRRLYREHGLDRRSRRDAAVPRIRLRWQADRPGALWHGDVCHAGVILIDAKPHPVRIHALLDDASRYVVALEAHHSEREIDMLGLLVRALRRHGPPDALYLDNGSTYRGDVLRTACARLGISLLHARPYDAPARGKMERFWRTLREGCLDFAKNLASLHDVGVRLWAFLDQHYHRAPHASLLGRSPGAVFAEGARLDELDEEKLRSALTVRVRRRVRRDSTNRRSSIDGRTTRHQGYAVSQRCRKRVEEIFGWMKVIGGLRKTRYRGVERTGLWAYLVATAYNLVRMVKLQPEVATA